MCSIPDAPAPPPAANKASQVGKSAAGALEDPNAAKASQAADVASAGTDAGSYINNIFGLTSKATGEKASTSNPIAQFLLGG